MTAQDRDQEDDAEQSSSLIDGLDAGRTVPIGVNDVSNFIGIGPFQWLAFMLAGVCGIGLNFDMLTTSLVSLSIDEEWGLNGVGFSLITSLSGVTSIVGGLLFAVLSDMYGRVWPLALALVVVATGGLASAFAPSFAVFLALRCFTGFGLMAVIVMSTSMLLEFLPVRSRGKIVTLTHVLSSLGSGVGAGLSWWLIPSYPRYGWRYVIIASALPLFLAAAFRMLFFYQSPRYLIARKRYKDAAKLLRTMAAFNRKDINVFLPDGTSLEAVLAQGTDRDQNKLTLISNLRRILTIFKPPLLYRTVCFFVIAIMVTITIMGIVLFTPILMKSLGADPYFVLFTSILAQIPGLLLMSIITEWQWFGRRNTLRIFTAMGIIFALLLAFVQNEVTIPIFTMLLYFAMFPLTVMAVIFISESYPTEIRAQAMTFFTSVNGLFRIAFPYIYGYITDLTISTWLFPTVMAIQYFILLVAAMFVRHDTLGRDLTDSVSG